LINSPNANWANVKPAIAAAATFACSTSSGSRSGFRSVKQASAGTTVPGTGVQHCLVCCDSASPRRWHNTRCRAQTPGQFASRVGRPVPGILPPTRTSWGPAHGRRCRPPGLAQAAARSMGGKGFPAAAALGTPAAPSNVSKTTAKAFSSQSRSRLSGVLTRIEAIPMPKRKSLVSRKPDSMPQRFP
jgi:hypothetical protein